MAAWPYMGRGARRNAIALCVDRGLPFDTLAKQLGISIETITAFANRESLVFTGSEPALLPHRALDESSSDSAV